MSSARLVCIIASFAVYADAAAFIKADDAEVVVGADAKQMMRNANHPASHTGHTTNAPSPAKTVNINLYYETRCPDCIEFINNTLAKMWSNKDIRPYLNLTMNPYGNAMSLPLSDVSEGYKFWHPETTGDGWEYVHICQHGSDECLGNLIQACVISDSSVKQEKYLELVFCMAERPDWSIEKASYECLDKAGIDHKPVKECVNSPAGNKLFAEFGKQTQAVPDRQGTPWVMINGQNLVDVTTLMSSVCGDLGDHGPSSCSPYQGQPAPAPADAGEDPDPDFTVLPALKKKVLKKKEEFVVLSPKQI